LAKDQSMIAPLVMLSSVAAMVAALSPLSLRHMGAIILPSGSQTIQSVTAAAGRRADLRLGPAEKENDKIGVPKCLTSVRHWSKPE
jgi:hypothetical protein